MFYAAKTKKLRNQTICQHPIIVENKQLFLGPKKVCMCLCDDENCLNLGQQSLGLKIRPGGTRGPRERGN